MNMNGKGKNIYRYYCRSIPFWVPKLNKSCYWDNEIESELEDFEVGSSHGQGLNSYVS